MNIVGLVTEYNPFHLGHLYHLKNSKFLTKCDYSISIMSGNFLQRGEPAMLDKWARAKMAVDNGVDLVIELPFAYASQSAEIFSYGAVKILDSLNCVDSICFGSEEGSVEALSDIADILVSEPDSYRALLKEQLQSGVSFPSARQSAVIQYISENQDIDLKRYEKIISSPNNILGIEYIKALKRLNSNIKPATIQRISSNYSDKKLRKKISSATAIRNTFFESNTLDDVADSLPAKSFEVMESFLSNHKSFNRIDNFSDIIFYTLLQLKTGELSSSSFMDLDVDLKNRFIKALKTSNNLEQVFDNIKTRRYTSTRINRVLVHMLNRAYESDIRSAISSDSNYIRVLGCNKKGFEILKKIKANSNTHIVNKISDIESIDDEVLLNMIKLDTSSTDLYYLGLRSASGRSNQCMDYLKSPYIQK